MMLVLSGEGPTDLGECRTPVGVCSDLDFRRGPLTVLLDHLLAPILNYRPSQIGQQCVFVTKSELSRREGARKGTRRVSFVGKKRDQETGYFYMNAWMLGEIATELERERRDMGITVMHRDSDDARSTGRATWESKFKSMGDGFHRSGYARGVPMLPRPISESWLLCAAQSDRPSCGELEQKSGNPHSHQPLKLQLARALGGEKGAEALCDWLEELTFDVVRARSMPSFAHFHDALKSAVSAAMH